MEYQQIAAAWFSSLPSTDPLVGVLERWGWGLGGLVFGTLLGPEATGPGSFLWGGFPGLCVSGFLAAPIAHVLCVWGVWFGVVV